MTSDDKISREDAEKWVAEMMSIMLKLTIAIEADDAYAERSRLPSGNQNGRKEFKGLRAMYYNDPTSDSKPIELLWRRGPMPPWTPEDYREWREKFVAKADAGFKKSASNLFEKLQRFHDAMPPTRELGTAQVPKWLVDAIRAAKSPTADTPPEFVVR